MTFHIFTLVWGAPFVRKYVELTLHFQLMPGNLPALAQDDRIIYHLYTDRESRAAFEPEIKTLEEIVEVQFHSLEEMTDGPRPLLEAAAALKAPEYKYFIQKFCVRDCAKRAAEEDALELVDSNFIVADGGLGRLAALWDRGARGVMVNVLRNTEAAFADKWWNGQGPIGPRELFDHARQHFHPLHHSYFIDSAAPTSYPIQVCWPVDGGQVYGRSFLPHPLMIPARPAIQAYQSTMDYDLTLRVCEDEEITVVSDSDEILVCKFSELGHQATFEPGPPITPENLALFILTSTHNRHKRFAAVGNRFRGNTGGGNWDETTAQADDLIEKAYAEVDRIISLGPQLDARFLMYIKSYLGPIEDYMSPEMEPAELRNLTGENTSP
ncbi:MAG: hypothetical protein VW169_03285 [Rhodospirillaceae bacterium]